MRSWGCQCVLSSFYLMCLLPIHIRRNLSWWCLASCQMSHGGFYMFFLKFDVSVFFVSKTKSGMMVSCVVSNIPWGFQHVCLIWINASLFFPQTKSGMTPSHGVRNVPWGSMRSRGFQCVCTCPRVLRTTTARYTHRALEVCVTNRMSGCRQKSATSTLTLPSRCRRQW